MPRRTTIRDIADRADVHYSTVSLALRNSPKIRPDLRARIRAIADQLGYVPDPALSALTAYRNSTRPVRYQSTLAWVNNWPVQTEMRRIKTFENYHAGARERAQQLGFRIDEIWLHAPGMTPAAAHAILQARNITGLLIAPQPFAHTPLHLNLADFSPLAFGYSLQPANLHVVTNHQYQSSLLLMHELRALGYRRIGLFIRADWNEKVNNAYLGGLLLTQHQQPARDRVPPYLPSKDDEAEFRAWFRRHRPDVVVTLGGQVRGWLEKGLSLRIPEDVGLVHPNVDAEDPWLAGIHQNDRLIGATAVDFLAGMLQRNERGVPATPIRTLVEGAWKPGRSVRRMTDAIELVSAPELAPPPSPAPKPVRSSAAAKPKSKPKPRASQRAKRRAS